MKRLLPLLSSTLLLARAALATDPVYINWDTVTVTWPANGAYPVIDATTFINYGRFFFTNLNSSGIGPVLPYQTRNTLNYTNSYLMVGSPGFNFDFFDGASHYRSANFVNAGTVQQPDNAAVYGNTYLLASADNIVNRGLLAIGDAGLLRLQGDNVDLARSQLLALNNGASPGLQSVYWGAETNRFSGRVTPPTFSGPLLVTNLQGQFYFRMSPYFQLPPNFESYFRTNSTGTNSAVVDILLLGQTNSAISTEVRFSPFSTDWGSLKVVQWQAVLTNRLTGQVSSNQVYLTDSLYAYGDPFPDPNPPAPRNPESWIVQTATPFLYSGLFSAATFRPINYNITRAYPFFTNLTAMTNVAFDPHWFDGTNSTVWATNTAYGANLTAPPYSVDPSVQGSTFSNVPGRIEITADHVLDLTRAHIDGESYLLLKAPNHFIGATNADIRSAVSDFDLASTNGTLTIANLTTPTLPRITGWIAVWSGRWTNVTSDGFITTYNVSVIDSELIPETPSLVNDLTLCSTNLYLSDTLNVLTHLRLDAEHLTITSNGPSGYTPTGELNFLAGDYLWTPNLPHLRCLTNFGKLTTASSAFFATASQPPWLTGALDAPYRTFVNHGLVSFQGGQVWADYLESNGPLEAGVGPLSLAATYGRLTDSALTATNADISITSSFLLLSNQFLHAGRTIYLSVTNVLSDGVPNIATLEPTNQLAAALTNGNGWQSGYGLCLPVKPGRGDLLGTTITNFAAGNVEVPVIWGAEDRGLFDPANPTTSGFLNNAAIGRLILDGQTNSLFAFYGPTANNALYVDCLEFRGWTGDKVLENNTDPVSLNHILQVAPNMKVYYAQALANGVSVAEKLSQLGIGFIWVSNYNYGYFSSTNLVYQDGEIYRVNAALAASCDIVSNTNFPPTVNCQNPYPGPIWPVALWSPATNNLFTPPVSADPPRIIAQPASVSARAGECVRLHVAAEGSEPLSYQWRQNGAPLAPEGRISGAQSPHLVLNGALQSDSGSYDVLVSNPYGAVASSVAVVTVAAGPADPLDSPKLGFPAPSASNSIAKAFGQGLYYGLFSDTNGVSAASSGFFTAKTTAAGTYSGKISLAGRSYSFSGAFSPSTGLSGATISRGAMLPPLSLLLHLEDPNGEQMRGRITADHWKAELLAYRQVFNKSTRPAAVAGKYTLLIPADASGPAGSGFGALTVDANGALRWKGALSDGAKLSQATIVGPDGIWPLYASLYGGTGCLIGWMQFAPSPASGLGGQCLWLHPAASASRYSLGAFTNDVQAIGSAYQQTRSPLLPLNGGSGTLTLNGGGLAGPFTRSLSLNSRSRFVLSPNSSLKLKLNASSGLFSGSAMLPLGKTSFQGVLIQQGNFGAGFFRGPGQSGEVNLSPAP